MGQLGVGGTGSAAPKAAVLIELAMAARTIVGHRLRRIRGCSPARPGAVRSGGGDAAPAVGPDGAALARPDSRRLLLYHVRRSSQ